MAKDVLAVLDELTRLSIAPAFVRSDNGPEFTVHALRSWSENSGTGTVYIKPGSPLQNGFAESFNRRFRDELLHPKLVPTD